MGIFGWVHVPDVIGEWRWATRAAIIWCLTFGALHLFWAVGGAIGLASSAGHDLATRRPSSFVVFGLYGPAVVLLAATAVLVTAAEARAVWRRTAAFIVVLGVGVALVVRGVGLELALATNLGGVRSQVGPEETFWSQILWNPWFFCGGLLFIAASLQTRQCTARQLGRHGAR